MKIKKKNEDPGSDITSIYDVEIKIFRIILICLSVTTLPEKTTTLVNCNLSQHQFNYMYIFIYRVWFTLLTPLHKKKSIIITISKIKPRLTR